MRSFASVLAGLFFGLLSAEFLGGCIGCCGDPFYDPADHLIPVDPGKYVSTFEGTAPHTLVVRQDLSEVDVHYDVPGTGAQYEVVYTVISKE